MRPLPRDERGGSNLLQSILEIAFPLYVRDWQRKSTASQVQIQKATIDRLEDSEYSLEVNKKLGIRYNYPP